MSVTQQLEVSGDGGGGGVAPTKKPKKKSILQFEITKKKVPRKDLMQFSRQLSVFIKAGIPILDAMEAINEEMGNKLLREIVEDMTTRLREGSTFANAAAAHEDAFPPYYLGILRSAELTGHLDVALLQLSEYVERDLEAKRKITSALAYPGVIFATAIVVVVILVSFVLPKFEAFFKSLNAKLPLPTRLLLSITGGLTNNALVIGLSLLGFVVLILVLLRTEKGRAWRDATLLRLPVVGDLLQHIILERFCRILSAMMSAGVPLPEALTVTTEATSNTVYQRGLDTARTATLHGEGLAGPLIATGLFPASARQMFRVGESTGTLDQQLATSAEYFARELDYKIKRFTSLFEPAVLLFVGLIVGFVAIALVSAMYGIFGQSRSV
jgi:type IV pilus assembly protein PilC